MRKLFLVEAKVRVLLSLAAVFFLVTVSVIIDSIDLYGRWQEESKSYQEWIKSDHSQICKKARDEQRTQCDLAVITKPVLEHSLDNEARRTLDRLHCLYSSENELELNRLGCSSQTLSSPRDPGSLAEFTWSKQKTYLPDHLPIIFITVVGVFIWLTAGRVFLTETHIGWRRVSLVIGALVLALIIITTIFQINNYDEDLWLSAILALLIPPPLSVLLVLGGRRIHSWIYAGFHPEQQITEPVRDTAVVESSSVIDSSVPTDPIATRTLGDSLDAFLEEKKTSNNYLVRHWRGELSLPVSYWINGAVLGGIVSIVLLAAASEIGNGDYSPRTILFVITGILLFSIAVWLWSVVGIWRSADHHVARGGSYVWASTARVIVVLSFIAMANDLSTNVLPQVKELALIVIGNDPLGEIVIKVPANGQSVSAIGTLREGSAAEVLKILDATPAGTQFEWWAAV